MANHFGKDSFLFSFKLLRSSHVQLKVILINQKTLPLRLLILTRLFTINDRVPTQFNDYLPVLPEMPKGPSQTLDNYIISHLHVIDDVSQSTLGFKCL